MQKLFKQIGKPGKRGKKRMQLPPGFDPSSMGM
jgi:hypothetical protein